MKKFFCAVVALCLVAPLVGCEKKPDGLPKLTPVTVTIKQDGKPLSDANVSFFAQTEANKKWVAGGTTDAQGVIEVMTMGKYKGMVADTFKVTVMKTLIENPQLKEDDPPGDFYSLVDKKYMTEATTDLTIEVSGSGPLTFDLDVGPEVKEKQ